MMAHGRQTYAHRLVLELGGITVPPEAHVLHVCDNPPCVNPSHLMIGTNYLNRLDSMRKRRHQYGERHWNAILTDAAVLDMRRLYDAGSFDKYAASARYGVTPLAALLAANRHNWKHLP